MVAIFRAFRKSNPVGRRSVVALDQVTFDSGGICEVLAGGAIHMVMGTHGTAAMRSTTDRHARAGQLFVSAPVLGRPDVAAVGQLGVIVVSLHLDHTMLQTAATWGPSWTQLTYNNKQAFSHVYCHYLKDHWRCRNSR